MDGTIADLYGVEGWLDYLHKSDVTPYAEAKPLYDMTILNSLLKCLKTGGWYIVVTTWCSKGGSKAFNKATKQAKVEWLKRYNFPADEVHVVKYGTTKADCTRYLKGYQILVDDNKKVREGWHLGDTINANGDIIKELYKLLEVF